ncbi:hypothetical protein AB4K08_00900 [Serratia fonticola]|uniref:hypothetical protein n=1 Tax=Serratia fonticola TaxID=47917 RepID=UPI0034C6DCEB
MREISNKRLAANQIRKLNTLRKRIDELAADWDDVDQCVMAELLMLSQTGFDKCIEQLEAHAKGELDDSQE